MTPRPDEQHRPVGVDDETVEACGKLSEALEWVERARGRLYDFHQMIGHADFLFEEAADKLAGAGHTARARDVRRCLVGRNVIDGRWTFQVIDEFDDLYYAEARRCAHGTCAQLLGGRRHVYEAELKERRRSRGLPGHEAAPPGRSRSAP